MNKIKLVIFDMDGLLVDSESHYSQGWKYAIKQNGYAIDDSIVDTWVGQGIQKTIDVLINLTGEQNKVNEIVKTREVYIYKQLENDKIEEMPFATEVLHELSENGFKIAVASSTHKKRAEAILKKLDLLKFINYACYGDEVEQVKPNPAIYNKILTDSDFSAEEAIAVEDSYAGTKSASLAGLSTVVIPYVDFEKDRIKNINNVIDIGQDLRSVLNHVQLKL